MPMKFRDLRLKSNWEELGLVFTANESGDKFFVEVKDKLGIVGAHYGSLYGAIEFINIIRIRYA